METTIENSEIGTKNCMKISLGNCFPVSSKALKKEGSTKKVISKEINGGY